jgi:hypothetical protein
MNLEQLRSFRIYNMAIFDWVGTLLVTFYLIKYFKLDTLKTLLIIIPLIVLFHKIFKVNSVITTLFDEQLWMKLFVQVSIIFFFFI